MGLQPHKYPSSLSRLKGACIACLLALTVAQTADAAGTGSGVWEKRKASTVLREAATATLLANGKVLLAGGDEAGSAELYDPAGNSWTATGSMVNARSNHRATALADGRVLVTGGLGKRRSGGPDQVRPVLEAAEIYNPGTGKWSPAGSLSPGRFGHVALALADGRVLVAGGRVGGHDPTLTDSALFDPEAGSWSQAGALGSGRSDFAATRLKDGRVLVTGGWPGGHSESRSDGEIFDPGAGTWTPAAHVMGARRASHTSTLLGDGRVLLAGGSTQLVGGGFDAALSSAELFDPAAGDFTATLPMKQRRMDHTATLLPDGGVLVAGFFGHHVKEGKPALAAERFQPASGTWSPTASVRVIPGFHDAMTLSRGCGPACGAVLLIGTTEDAAQIQANFAETYRLKAAASPGNRDQSPRRFPIGISVALLLIAAVAVFWLVRRRSRPEETTG